MAIRPYRCGLFQSLKGIRVNFGNSWPLGFVSLNVSIPERDSGKFRDSHFISSIPTALFQSLKGIRVNFGAGVVVDNAGAPTSPGFQSLKGIRVNFGAPPAILTK